MNYAYLHRWMNKTYPRIGRCEQCGYEGYTEYASIEHRYTRDRADWQELCKPCHIAIDGNHTSTKERAKTQCKRGHAYDEANTYRNSKGHRSCRACHREWAMRHRQLVAEQLYAPHPALR